MIHCDWVGGNSRGTYHTRTPTMGIFYPSHQQRASAPKGIVCSQSVRFRVLGYSFCITLIHIGSFTAEIHYLNLETESSMCGRAVQTVQAAHFAASSFGAQRLSHPGEPRNDTAFDQSNDDTNNGGPSDSSDPREKYSNVDRDNYNMSPGMDAAVIWMENGELKMDRKVWGLVTKGGSIKQPLPSDSKSRMGMHFAGLMYNARTDTLYAKPTFSRLAQQKRSCLVALDGYFEWKASPLAGGKGKKQPYFVYRNKTSTTGATADSESPPYLLMPGLWTRVPTGLSDEPFLDTFTILTTEANKQIEWLHHRMPVCVWDMDLAKQWLNDPSPKVHQEIERAAKANIEGLAWHMVTTDMSSVKFRGKESIEPKKGPKPMTAFFAKIDAKVAATTSTAEPAKKKVAMESPSVSASKATGSDEPKKSVMSTPNKRSLPTTLAKSSPGPTPKKSKKNQAVPGSNKKGLITSFFQKTG